MGAVKDSPLGNTLFIPTIINCFPFMQKFFFLQNTAPYHGSFGVSLDGSPDFQTIASAYGIPSMVVNDEDKLDETIAQFLSTKGSCLLICEVHPDVSTTD